jgi:transmembrane sensor
MKHQKYTVEDIAQDKRFRDWVLSENSDAAEYWSRWLAEHPDQLPLIREARFLVRNIRFREHHLSSGDKQKLWEQIDHRTGPSTRKEGPVRYLNPDKPGRSAPQDSEEEGTAHFPRRTWTGTESAFRHPALVYAGKLAAAAVVLIALGLGAALWLSPAADDAVTYRTGYGETQSVTLTDGTEVVLNANTELRIAPTWEASGSRDVWLEGEAYFNVSQTGHPFVVHTGEIDAHVLGTAFNAYARNNKVLFELASGRLLLDNRLTRTSLEMAPGDQVVYKDASVDPERRKIQTAEVAAWRENLLIFRRTPLDEIGALLADNYGLDVIFKDEQLSRQYFTGTIPSDDIDRLLATLSRAFDLNIERRDRTVIIQNDTETR